MRSGFIWTFIFVALVVASSSWAQSGYNQRHQAGVRLGVWSNRGDASPLSDSTDNFKSNIKDECFYFEGYYARRIFQPMMIEGALGIVNRGSVTFIENGIENAGNLLVYTILVKAKLYPLASLKIRLQPYLTLGGGFYYGRRTVQFTTNSTYYDYYGEQTASDFDFVFGGGIDWPFSSVLGLEASVKYMSIGFSSSLLTVRNYDALAICIGLKYIYKL